VSGPELSPGQLGLFTLRCSTVSQALLGYLEKTFAEFGPSGAATALVMLAGRLQGRHGDDQKDAEGCWEDWVKSWKLEPVKRVFMQGFNLERESRPPKGAPRG
jgi:hypothetical protein